MKEHMIINIYYSDESKIAKTSPMIATLFKQSIISCIEMTAHVEGIEDIKVKFIPIHFSVHNHSNFLLDLPSEITICSILEELFKHVLYGVWPATYNGIEKMEMLVDMYGGITPTNLFGSTCSSEMEV